VTLLWYKDKLADCITEHVNDRQYTDNVTSQVTTVTTNHFSE